MGHKYVGTEHLAIPLLDAEGTALILSSFGVSKKQVLEELADLLGVEPSVAPPVLTSAQRPQIEICLALPEFISAPSVTTALVELFEALDAMNRVGGGPGLKVEEGRAFLGSAVCEGTPR